MNRLDRFLYLIGRDTKRDPEYAPMGREEALRLVGDALKSASRNPYGTVEQREDRRKYAGDSVLEHRVVWNCRIPKTKRDFIRTLSAVIEDFTAYGEGHDVLLPGAYLLTENEWPNDSDLTRIELSTGNHPLRRYDGSDRGTWWLSVEAYREVK